MTKKKTMNLPIKVQMKKKRDNETQKKKKKIMKKVNFVIQLKTIINVNILPGTDVIFAVMNGMSVKNEYNFLVT